MTGDEPARRESRPARVRDFLVPDLGEGLEDATITSWSVAVGDTVELNQTLCTVETNKAEVEIPSPYAGRIAELGGGEGETLNVGAVLVRIATGAEPVVESTAKRKPVLVGYGADDAMDSSRRAVGAPSARPRTKPPVRKLAAELNVDLHELAGSGPDGVITRDDVLSSAGRSAPSPDMVAVRGVQAEMAHRMSLSRREIPDAHAGVQVDGTSLLRLRDRLRDQAGEDVPITPFVLTLRLLTIALCAPPEAQLDVGRHHRRTADPSALRGASGIRCGGAARAAGARRQRRPGQDDPSARRRGGRG